MQTRVFSSAADAGVFLVEERSSPGNDFPSATLLVRSAVVLAAIVVAVSMSGHRGLSLPAHVTPRPRVKEPR